MATGGEDLSEETPEFLCNTCKQDNDVNKSAVDYCRACCEYFCEGCLTRHNGKVAKKHHRDELLGKDTLRSMLSTRLMTATPVPYSDDDVLFCCRNCNDADAAGDLKTAVDYCRTCSEYLCNTCLFAHNKWTKHGDKLLGKEDMKSMINARNRSRRRTFDRKLVIGHDITKHTENYCRLAVLIVKGCTRIMRVLFLRHVESSTPAGHPHSPWTVDEFLLTNKTDICKRLGKEKGMLPGIKESILFPSQCATDLEKWDLVLLSFILLDICNYKDKQPLSMHLDKMKKVRNSLCHRGDASITNDDFDIYFDQVKTSIENCCNYLADKAFKDEMSTLVHNVEHSALSLDESSRLLKEWFDSDRHIEGRLEQHGLVLQATKAKVETVGADVKAISSNMQAMDTDIRTRDTDTKNILAIMMDKIDALVANSGAKPGVPDAKVGIFMKNSRPEKERIISEILENMINPKLRNHPKLKAELSEESYQIIYQLVQEALEVLLSEYRELLDVSRKCVILSIRCPNYNSFKDLLYQSTSGGLTELFKPVERAIRDIEGYEHVELEVTISDEDFVTAMDALVANILTAYGFTQDELAAEQSRMINEPERKTVDSATDQSIRNVSILSAEECEELTGRKQEGTCILVDIKPRSIGHYIHIVENSTSESMKVALQDLADVLRDYYQLKDLSIEAMPVETKALIPDASRALLESDMTDSKDNTDPRFPEQPVDIKTAMTNKGVQGIRGSKMSELELFEQMVGPDDVEDKYSKDYEIPTSSKQKVPEWKSYPDSPSDLHLHTVVPEQPCGKQRQLNLIPMVGSDDVLISLRGSKQSAIPEPAIPEPAILKPLFTMTPKAGSRLTPGTMVTSVDRKEKIAIREKRDILECWAFGVCSLPDGGWLVSDYNNHVLKRLDVSGSVVDRCTVPGDPWDVCFIQDHNVASVTTGNANRIELISLDGDMTLVRTIQTDHYCYRMTYANNKLYVTSYVGKEIYEHDYSDGQLDRTICPRDSQGEERFSSTLYITSSEDGSRLFMIDEYRGLFIIDTRTADVIQQVDVGWNPLGVCLGEDDELFVVADSDGTIRHLDRNGTKLDTVVTWEMMEGHRPEYVSYDKRTARLAVTVVGGRDYMFVFHMK